jgi:hypothetical protein
MRFVRENGLTLFFTAIFVLAVVGQAFTGHAEYNNQLVADGLHGIGFVRYVTSSNFAVDLAENWQSEYLQFVLYVFVTVWLVQKGSPESKKIADVGTESERAQKVGEYSTDDSPSWARRTGWRLRVYSHSLVLVMGSIFVLSWLAQSVAGQVAYNEEQLRRLEDPVSWTSYIGTAEFWNRTLQNWQSEFLAVASMAALAIYLRERGSPESKPVGTSHSATGVEG